MVNGNGTKNWVFLVQQLGVPTAFASVLLGILIYLFIMPMQNANDRMIESNIETQGRLTTTIETMGIELKEQRGFMSNVEEIHKEHLEVLQEDLKIDEDVKAIMEDAQRQMAEVPTKRDEQIKLLTEIRDKLDVQN